MTLDYFYGQSGELFSYFRILRALFQDCRFRQISTDARTLYGILLDRIIVPYFRKCNIKLVDLKATDLQDFYTKQLERVKANSVIHYHASINKQSVHSPVGEMQERTDLENQPTARRTPPSQQKHTKEKAADSFESATSGGDGGIRTHVPD